jgi:hypothetical protein
MLPGDNVLAASATTCMKNLPKAAKQSMYTARRKCTCGKRNDVHEKFAEGDKTKNTHAA